MCRQSREQGERSCENLPCIIAKSAGKEITVRHSWLQHKRYESKPQIWKKKQRRGRRAATATTTKRQQQQWGSKTIKWSGKFVVKTETRWARRTGGKQTQKSEGGRCVASVGQSDTVEVSCLSASTPLLPSQLMLLTHNLPLYECVNHASFSTAVALSNEVGHSSNPNLSPPSTRVKWFGLAWQICNTIYHTEAARPTTTTKPTRCVRRFKFDLQMMLNPFGFFFFLFFWQTIPLETFAICESGSLSLH